MSQRELPLPPDIVTVIEQRIGLLSPQARHLAQLAAVAGQSFSVPLAAAALACPLLALSGPLRELELRQVLYGRRFVHDVISAGVNRTIPRSVAEFMHRFVAEYLEQHQGQPAHVAVHWQEAGEPQRAGDAYRLAAHAAAEASRPLEQSTLRRRGRSLLRAVRRRRLAVRRARGATGRPPRARCDGRAPGLHGPHGRARPHGGAAAAPAAVPTRVGCRPLEHRCPRDRHCSDLLRRGA